MTDKKNYPTLITGMHRSGTSMIAHLLRECGLYLGPEDKMLPPGEGNPSGFWENVDMDAATEETLTVLSGDWDFLLPVMPAGWAASPDLENARTMGQRSSDFLARQHPWGWKDPRASIVIPFWKSLLPDLNVVIVLRHPLEVTRSLQKRVDCSVHMANHLWVEYARRILADTTPEERIVTHYDAFFLDPLAELRRVTQWLELDVTEEVLIAAAQKISKSTREQLVADAAPLPYEMVTLYETFIAETSDQTRHAIENGDLPRPTAMDAPPQLPTFRASAQAETESMIAFDEAQRLLGDEQSLPAMEKLNEAVTLNPHHSAAQNDLGVLLMQAGEPTVALPHFEIAHKLKPEEIGAVANMAAAYIELGIVEGAIKLYLSYLEHSPQDLDALSWLARVAIETGAHGVAHSFVNRLLEIDPDNADAAELLQKIPT